MVESIASYRRRMERERRYEAEAALERRTYRTRNEYGERRHMVDWSREQIDKWERETELKRQLLKSEKPQSEKPLPKPAKPRNWWHWLIGWRQ